MKKAGGDDRKSRSGTELYPFKKRKLSNKLFLSSHTLCDCFYIK